MRIIKVTYQKSFVTGPFLQERIGFEAEIDESEDSVTAALSDLRALAEGWHNNSNPHLHQEEKYPQPFPDPNRWEHMTDLKTPMKTTFESSPMPIIDRSSKEKLEIAIDNADSIETLSALKEEASKHGLVSQYMAQLKKLTNGDKD